MNHASLKHSAPRQRPMALLAVLLALVGMMAMGSGALGYGHQQLQHAGECSTSQSCVDGAERSQDAPQQPKDPAPSDDCELCDLIKASQQKLLIGLEVAGLATMEPGEHFTIEHCCASPLAVERVHFARPPPALF